MADADSIRQLLETKRKAVAAARKQAEKAKKNVESLEAELKGAEEFAEAILGTNPSTPRLPESGNRGLSDKWKRVIGDLAQAHPKTFSLDEIGALAIQYGIKVTGDTLRGQMHHYSTESRYVERVGPGVFRGTLEGAAAAGVALGISPNPSDDAEDEEIPF